MNEKTVYNEGCIDRRLARVSAVDSPSLTPTNPRSPASSTNKMDSNDQSHGGGQHQQQFVIASAQHPLQHQQGQQLQFIQVSSNGQQHHLVQQKSPTQQPFIIQLPANSQSSNNLQTIQLPAGALQSGMQVIQLGDQGSFLPVQQVTNDQATSSTASSSGTLLYQTNNLGNVKDQQQQSSQQIDLSNVLQLIQGGSSNGQMVVVQMMGSSMPQQPVMRSDEEPLYVNAKQYHRILKRRAARAKLEQDGRIPKQRQVLSFLIIPPFRCTVA
uniref:Nuclear transcription factor Y subunit n=1 Tax=Plectus sambesii TaxID=2011161 RepID=A0A914X8M4_9BILA